MRNNKLIASMLALGLLGSVHAFAQDDDTMMVIDEGATPEDIVNVLQLPEMASEIAVDASARGLGTAREAREDGRAFGREQAEAARERVQDVRESARESARDRAQERARDMPRPGRAPDERPGPPAAPPTP